ncbi:transposase [Prevotella dentalis DSM 3688]|uniref:Transposase n=1 Tax=Prevotella dentalis (strain ATCC 49559 / DSM 3688 / JCM 13448 / NCTC 12043 / ES 2772) TaxID=908937 RepID=F9D046_PREDD|nr:transposase [Prevotella dentalis DSM 3688]
MPGFRTAENHPSRTPLQTNPVLRTIKKKQKFFASSEILNNFTPIKKTVEE